MDTIEELSGKKLIIVDGKPKIIDGETHIVKNINKIIRKIREIIDYLKDKNQKTPNEYVAIISQTETNNPECYVFSNTIGDIAWERISAGNYKGTLANTFLVGKTHLIITQNKKTARFYIRRINNNTIGINSCTINGTDTDELLEVTPIYIRIYK